MRNIHKIMAAIVIMVMIATIEINNIENVKAANVSQNESINNSIMNMKAIEQERTFAYNLDDNKSVYKTKVNYFIKVSGNTTYTFSSQQTYYVIINLNQLNQVNKTLREGIKDTAMIKWNYSLPNDKVLFVPYVRGDNI